MIIILIIHTIQPPPPPRTSKPRLHYLVVLLCFLHTTAHAATSNEGQLGVSIENHLYDWKGENNLKGSQYVTPVNITYQKGAFNAGLRRAYIQSANKSPNQRGELSGWSDTSASLAYTLNQESNLPIRLNLSANLPNGKATLSGDEKNAIMDGNLVWQTRLGEGRNITPGINIAHSFTDKDTIGFGISKIFRGEFDPNADVENDEINPGDDTIATVQYTRTGQRGQMSLGFTHQSSGITTRAGKAYYQKGHLRTLDANGQYALTPNQLLYGGYSYSYRQKDKYINNLTGDLEAEQFNSNGGSHWLNVGYSWYFKDKHNVGTSVDYLKIKSNSYDQINALYIPARTKVGVGANYQYQITPQAQLSLSAKRFNMKDDPTPYLDKQEYRGWNMFGSLGYQF